MLGGFRKLPPIRRLSGCVGIALALLITPIAAATVLGFFGQLWWVFDLMAHFRIQYMAVLLVAAATVALVRRWAVLAIILSFILMNSVPLAPYYVRPRSPVEANAKTLEILSLNVDDHRAGFDEVLALITSVDADVVLLIEIDERWVQAVELLGQTYPYQVLAPREGFFGMALLSRFPLDDPQILTLGLAGLPSISARLRTPWTNLQLVATHPYPPVGRRQSALRNEQLAAVADYSVTLPRPVVLVGDLNATPWSLPLRRLIGQTGLRDSALGFGVQPTWPAGMLLARIQIDQCLVSEELKVVRRDVGPDVGSDHLPLVVELAWPSEQSTGGLD